VAREEEEGKEEEGERLGSDRRRANGSNVDPLSE